MPFVLFAYAALHLPASYLVILNASAPLFAAVASAVWLADRLTPGKVVGLVVGAAGVTLVSRAGPVVLDAAVQRWRSPPASARRSAMRSPACG